MSVPPAKATADQTIAEYFPSLGEEEDVRRDDMLPHTPRSLYPHRKVARLYPQNPQFLLDEKKIVKTVSYSLFDQFSTGFDHCFCQCEFCFNHLQHIDS